jgi:hypothetical protein
METLNIVGYRRVVFITVPCTVLTVRHKADQQNSVSGEEGKGMKLKSRTELHLHLHFLFLG